MRRPTETLRGDVQSLTVSAGQWIVVQGALRNGVVEPGGALTVQGTTIDLRLLGDGADVIAQGTVAGTIEIQPGPTAIVHGLLVGTVVNAGRLVFHGESIGGIIDTRERGVQLGIEALPEEARAELLASMTQTITVEDRPTSSSDPNQ